MKTRLTLGEKLKDLRMERNLTLDELSNATGISTSTLQRTESDEDIRIGYQDIATLAKYYGVSTDYLFGVTDNRQFRNIEVDKLHLSDKAISELASENLNNRLISELISHEDFPQLLRAMEIYVDRKVQPQINTMNALYGFVEKMIKEKVTVPENDEMMIFLQQSVISEDEYLRFRISERFNLLIKSLFDKHKKDKLSPEHTDMFKEMKEDIDIYLDKRKDESASRAKAIVFSKQLGLNTSKLTDEEWRVLMKVLESSSKARRVKKRK